MDIKYHKSIYNKAAIGKAMNEFKHLADFTIKSTKEYHQLTVNNIKKDIKNDFQDEFSNYVLYLMNL